jgi:hypothetical protein
MSKIRVFALYTLRTCKFKGDYFLFHLLKYNLEQLWRTNNIIADDYKMHIQT